MFLWANQCTFDVEDGEIAGAKLRYASGPSKLILRKGRINCSDLAEGAKNHDGRCNVTIYGGEFNCTNNFVLTNGTALAISGGSLSVGKMVMADTTKLSLTGGAITNAAAITVAEKRLVTESKGTSLTTTAPKTAVDILEHDGETITFNAPFFALNGIFSITNRATLISDYPFGIKQFYYGEKATAATVPLTLRLSNLVIADQQLFNTGNGNARNFNFDGPVTMRPTTEEMSKSTSRTVYVLVDGELTVDTRDWNDASLKRTVAFRNIGSRNGNGSLVVRGGGTLYMTQTYSNPFRKVTVEEGTTLEMGPFENTEYSPLNAEKIVLGPNSVLKIQAASNTVHAGSWEIDPTARIEVSVASDFAGGGKSILRDWHGNLDGIASQITLSGDGASGCSLVGAGGVYSVVKPVSAVDGVFQQEWTGAAGDGKWTTAGNWYNNTAVVKGDVGKTMTAAFGCMDSVLNTDFNIAGAYIRNITFRETAVKSFTVTSSGERTFFTADNSCSTNASVYSASSVPQYVGLKFRRTGGGNSFSFAAKDAPIVITSPNCYPNDRGILQFVGDIRVSGNIYWPNINLTGHNNALSPCTRLTILDGGVLSVTNQTVTFGSANAIIEVCKGGLLEFKGLTDAAVYNWTQPPKKHIIDGELRIDATYCGGYDNYYGGSGMITLAGMKPMTRASALSLGDEVTAVMSRDWTTTIAGADYPLTIRAASFSTPKIKLSADWTYGPAQDANPVSTAADRALTIERGSVLTVVGDGHAAVFAEPVTGDGTLAVTNGTIRLDGGADGLGGLRLDAGGVLETDGDLTFGALTSCGGTVKFTEMAKPITVSGAADVDGLIVQFADSYPERWTTIMSAASITGTPVTTGNNEMRVTDGGDVKLLQCRCHTGFIVIVK